MRNSEDRGRIDPPEDDEWEDPLEYVDEDGGVDEDVIFDSLEDSMDEHADEDLDDVIDREWDEVHDGDED